jgi:2-polyprenyl-6-methoxyphenol hydroxylase-like FAD-dependent oxidoreductase
MTEHAVVIVGGGPTGLMLAGELALAGVDVAIVERRASQDPAGHERSPYATPLWTGAVAEKISQARRRSVGCVAFRSTVSGTAFSSLADVSLKARCGE